MAVLWERKSEQGKEIEERKLLDVILYRRVWEWVGLWYITMVRFQIPGVEVEAAPCFRESRLLIGAWLTVGRIQPTKKKKKRR